MSYISHCHCLHSSPSLWRKLTYMGLRHNPIQPQLSTRRDVALCVCDGFYQTLPLEELSDESVDCGDCEELFLALAALSDSTDLHQWFVYNDGIEEQWFRCNQDDVTDAMWEEGRYRFCRKATPAELMYHFINEI